MEIKVKRNFPHSHSQMEINVEEKDPKEALAMATVFTEPDKCLNCGNTEGIIWQANKAKSDKGGYFTYVKRICPKCKASSSLGEYVTGGFFWKNWEVYSKHNIGQSGNNQQQPQQSQQYNQEPPQNDDSETPPPTAGEVNFG